jgi:signal peptide peptidase SppA
VSDQIDLSAVSNGVQNISQYFGVWAVDDTQFLQTFKQVANMDLVSHVNSGPAVPQVSLTVSEQDERSIAIVNISGLMTKYGSSLSNAGSTVAIRQAVRKAGNDPNIAAIILRIDSPGGTVSGTVDLANEVRTASAKKPVYTYAEDLAASAGYWVGSQARKIYANNSTAQIGSIGTYIGTYDYSGKAEKEGIKAVVIKSGNLKGGGFPGAEITEEQINNWQGIVNKIQTQFSAAVSKGRRLPLSRVNELATGQVYMADDALSFGLIDKIGSFSEMLADIRGTLAGQTGRRHSAMSTGNTMAASIEEIQAACPKADDTFVLDVLKSGLTLSEAKTRYIENLNAQIEMREQETAEAKQSAEVLSKNVRRPGVDASLGSNGRPSQNYSGSFEELVRELVDNGEQRQAAVIKAAKRDPQGHREYLIQNNPGSKMQRLINDRFDM